MRAHARFSSCVIFSPNLLSPPRGRVKNLCPQVCQFGEAIAAFDSQQIGKPHRRGLTISMPAKSFSLSVTTIQSLASAIAAIIASRALRGLPFAVPSAIKRAQIRPALSSNGSTRPAKSAEGPSGPENQASSWSRFRPAGFSRIPRRISATVSEAMNRCSSTCSPIQTSNASEGVGFVMLLMMLVSRR